MESPSLTMFAESPNMKSKTAKISLIIISITLAALFFSLLYQSPDEAIAPTHQQTIERNTNASESHALVPQQAAPIPSAQDASTASQTHAHADVPASAMQWMEDSRDYRSVLIRLAQAGTPEAGLYSDHILKYCYSVVRSGVQNVKTDSSKQEFAKDLLWARCSSFSPDELTGHRMRELPGDSRFPDGLLQIRNEWIGAGDDTQKRQTILNQVFETKDPLLLEQVGVGLLISDTGKINFGNTEFSGQDSLSAVRNAWISAVCDGTGTTCGPGDQYVVDACANTGICESSRMDTFREITLRRQGEAYVQDFDSAYRIFLAAIQSGNPEILGPRLSR